MEILLKLREVKALNRELERCRELKGWLQKLILNEHFYGSGEYVLSESGRFSAPPLKRSNGDGPFVSDALTAFYASLEADDEDDVFKLSTRPVSTLPISSSGEYSVSSRRRQQIAAGTSSSGPLRLGGISSAPQVLYDVRGDGTVVRMRCPVCNQEKFRNMLGFVNHCRLNCKVIFVTQEERLIKGGVPVAPEDVPPEYQYLLSEAMQGELDIIQICADVQPAQVLEHVLPEISVEHDEPIDFSSFGINRPCRPAKIESPATDVVVPDFSLRRSTSSSRYYYHGSIFLGNRARCILNTGEEAWVGGRAATHIFQLYLNDTRPIVGSEMSHEALGDSVLRHVRFVRFFLLPAYAPDDIVDVYDRPFVLERPAYGEFPIRIQLHFFDERNKPVDIMHMLSIFSSTYSEYTDCSERKIVIDIGKWTDFSLSESAASVQLAKDKARAPTEAPQESVEKSDTEDFGSERDLSDASGPTLELDSSAVNPNWRYCRYCGVPHMPQPSFDIIQKNCAHRPRRIKISTRSNANDLFVNCKLSDKEIKFIGKETDLLHELTASQLELTGPDDYVSRSDSEILKFVSANVHSLSLTNYKPVTSTSLLIFSAMKRFMQRLINEALSRIPKGQERALLDQSLPTVLTPWHVFLAITQPENKSDVESNIYDFLTNANLSALNQNQQPPS